MGFLGFDGKRRCGYYVGVIFKHYKRRDNRKNIKIAY
jgi:hypothetical protein